MTAPWETEEIKADCLRVLEAAVTLEAMAEYTQFLQKEPMPTLMALAAAKMELENPLMKFVPSKAWVDLVASAISIAIVLWEDQELKEPNRG